MTSSRAVYPADSDEEWVLVAPYLTLLRADAGQREYSLREVFNGLRDVVKTGAPWRCMPNDLPPWEAVYQQAQRWLAAGCFEQLADDLRTLLRLTSGRPPRSRARPSSTVEPCARHPRAVSGPAGWSQAQKVHLAVDTLGHLLALHVTSADADDRAQIGRLAEAVQADTGNSVDLAYVDQGYTGEKPAKAARAHGIELEVVKLPETKRGFVLLPRRWVVKRSFAWATRFRRRVKDCERSPTTLADHHIVAFVCLMLKQPAQLAAGSYQPLDFLPCRASGQIRGYIHTPSPSVSRISRMP